MSLKNQTPPLLEPYLTFPPSKSLLLITSTLTNTPNWITAHLIASLLSPSSPDPPRNIILISYLHDSQFWTKEIHRLTGIDISKPQYSPRVHVIDCLTASCTYSNLLDKVSKNLHSHSSATEGEQEAHVIVDGLTLPVATGRCTADDVLGFVRVMRRRAGVGAVTVVVPFVKGGEQPVEVECGRVMVSLGHVARWVVGVRGLETGAAGDVSGVVRVTRGGGFYHCGEDEGEGREMEGLYLVRRDGGVEVRERGAS